MSNYEERTDVPANLNELKKSINRMSNWRERMDAVEELGKWKSRETIELLKYCVAGDPVYPVKEAAYRQLQTLGEKVAMPERKDQEVIPGTEKILVRIKKSLPKGHSYEDFKEKVKKMRLDLYDTYEGEKGAGFDKWLEEVWSTLPAK
ncbi:HEAT repeat domain-containing protein [Evansella sp. AB-P1]|uniref:HEAT repeat domain-containing protein n=1 Tax=Evansella sp. AB-P1 TaxID=3037653 RepID=UPI00241D42BC|nr:HEAT repeat domain-containing protein [Evansella sp. AB-P1]MDG5788520.1 HEAT repeat domain-containing protein [Evansella sp. AB-P1]